MSDARPFAAGWRSLDRSDLPGIVVSVLLVNLVGGAPAVLAGPDSAWFRALAKPTIYPPSWLFGVVWTLLFTLLGVALYLVWRERNQTRSARLALGLFVAQMVVNVSWTLAFFGLESVELGLGVIVLLWLLVVPMAIVFWRVSRVAAALVVPYLLWITFAAVLNYRFLVLN